MTLLSPSTLQQHGVHVTWALQKEGEFVVTFPAAFYANIDFGEDLTTFVAVFSAACTAPWPHSLCHRS